MCEMVDPFASRSAQVACAATVNKNDRENRKRGYEVKIEGSYLGGNFRRAREPDQRDDQIHGQVSVEESPNKTQE